MTNVKKHLTHLEAVGLIRLVKTHPELEFMFRHALIREAAYNSLLLADRKKLHRQVGEAIEQTYPNQVASRELAPVLADHFAKAEDDQRALKYFTLAGDANAAAYANAEAVENYTNALEIARRTETSRENLTYLYTSLGRVLELSSQFDQALTIYEEMEKLAQERNDRSMELASMTARLPLYAVPTPLHDPVQGQTLAEQALTLARERNNQAAEVEILWNLNNVYMYSNQVAQAIKYGEQSIALARQLNLKEHMALALNDVASNLWSIGQFYRAKESFREAISLWRELDNLPMLANSLSASCSAYVFAGDYDQAIAVSQEAFQICQDIDNLMGQAFSRMRVGLVHWERGQPDRAIAEMEEGIRLGELSGAMVPQITTRVDLSLVYGSVDAIDRGLDIAQHALELAETHIPFFRSYVLGALTQLHLMKGNLTEAEAAVDECNKDSDQDAWPIFYQFFRLAVIELALRQRDYERALTMTDTLLTDLHEFGMRMPMPSTLYLHGRALLELGQNETARDRLTEARTEAEAIGSRRMLWQILAALAELGTDPAEAEKLRQQAREIIEYIADHTPADLRASFLNLPKVRAVLEG